MIKELWTYILNSPEMEGEESNKWDVEIQGEELLITTCLGKKLREIPDKVKNFLERKMVKLNWNKEISLKSMQDYFNFVVQN